MEIVTIAGSGAIGKINNQYWVSIKKVCQNLKLQYERQRQKIKADETFEARLIEVPTAGRVQKVFCIPLEKLNG